MLPTNWDFMTTADIQAAARAELREWKRLTSDQHGLLLAFLVCLNERLEGRDPANLLRPTNAAKPALHDARP